MHLVPGRFTIYTCNSCNVLFTHPQLKEQELAKYYPTDYYSYAFTKKLTTRQKIELIFKNPIKFVDKIFEKAANILDYPFKRSILGKNGNVILDVGCGNGEYLKTPQLQSCDRYGIDIVDVNKVEFKKTGIKYFKCDLFQAPFQDGSFDIITLNHVFEHLNDPTNHANKIFQLLKPNGKVVIGIPNCASFNSRLFGQFWFPFDLPRHLFHYNTRSLIKIFRKAGFEVEKVRHNQMPGNTLGSLIYLFNSIVKRNQPLMENKLMKSGLFNFLLVPYTYLLNALKLGDQIEVIFRRRSKQIQ